MEDPLLGPLPDDVNKRGNRSSSPPAAGPLHSSGDSGGGVGGTIRSMPKFAGEMGVTASIAAAAAAATARATASSVATPIPANEEGRAGGRSVDNGEGGGRARKGRRARHMSPIQVAAGPSTILLCSRRDVLALTFENHCEKKSFTAACTAIDDQNYFNDIRRLCGRQLIRMHFRGRSMYARQFG